MHCIPYHTRNELRSQPSHLIAQIRDPKWVETRSTVPPPFVHALPGESAKLLHSAHNAGMIHWTEVAKEDANWSAMTDVLTMSSFAVSRDANKDKLISWPCVQNVELVEPPAIDLPGPSIFARLLVGAGKRRAFDLNIANLIHNIALPRWLVRFSR